MKRFCRFLFVLAVAVSCVRPGIINDAPVKYVYPQKTLSISRCNDLCTDFQEVLNGLHVQIVNDTVLVFQEQTNEANIYHFKAYSANTLSYLGAFVRNGRGPGEMVYPRVAMCNPREKYLNVSLNSIGEAYSVDIEKTIESGSASIAQTYALPFGIVDWLPLPGRECFVLREEKSRVVFQTLGIDGDVHKTFDLYGDYGDVRYLTHLSSILLNGGKNGMVAEVMLLFPQVNFIDAESGQVRSVAVSKDYRKWRSVMDGRLDMDTKEYYSAAAVTPDYIFAAYKGIPMVELNAGGAGSSIHIFDWHGHFLYDIRVSEDILSMAYDSSNGFLYAIDNFGGEVVRYDLGGLLSRQ